MTILLIENSESSYKLIKILLENLGTKVIRAHNVLEAENILNLIEVDLIMVDANLPGNVDGIEATRMLKERYQSIPVVIKSASQKPSDIIQSFYAGCDEYIVKPFTINNFSSLINKYDKSEYAKLVVA
jgi:DNA-binding response OmpR family regulator